MERVLQDPSVRKFTVVRHPHVRLLSAYLNKVVQVCLPFVGCGRLPCQPAGCLSLCQ